MKKKNKTFNVDEETIEIELNDDEISKLIIKLKELKESKAHLHLSFNNSKKELLIHHEGDELK